MEPIRIGTDLSFEKIEEIIEKYPLNKKVNIDRENYKDRLVYSFSLGKRKSFDEISLYNSLATLIQDIILKIYSKDLISFRVNKLLKDFSKSKKEEIVNEAYDLLINNDFSQLEKSIINNEILEYLIENNTLIIDGYLRFRSKTLKSLIDNAIEVVISHMQMENEFEEFINMLQYYVDSQIPKIELVHVIIRNGSYDLFDLDGNRIKTSSLNDIAEDLFFDDVTESDILVSSLIVLSPIKIIIHVENDTEKDLMLIIKQIFRERVVFCNGCNVCNHTLVNNKIEE